MIRWFLARLLDSPTFGNKFASNFYSQARLYISKTDQCSVQVKSQVLAVHLNNKMFFVKLSNAHLAHRRFPFSRSFFSIRLSAADFGFRFIGSKSSVSFFVVLLSLSLVRGWCPSLIGQVCTPWLSIWVGRYTSPGTSLSPSPGDCTILAI